MTRAAVALSTAAVAALLAACGSSSTSSQSTTATGAPTSTSSSQTSSASTPAPTAAPTPTPAAAGPLSGTWSGQYSGSYTGTFTLTWTQNGSTLSGQIVLSSPPQTLNINGTLTGNTISFGTVGSVAITYSGTVSGTSMSGNYQVGGAPSGAWSATKAS